MLSGFDNAVGFSHLAAADLADGALRLPKGDLTVEAKALLKPVLELLDSETIRPTGKKEWNELSGIRQMLRSLRTETYSQTLSQSLYALAMDLEHHPSFAPLAQQILQVLKDSDLPHAKRAAHQLDILEGRGATTSEYLQNTLRKLAQPGQYVPLAVAVGSASLLGKGVRLLSQAWMKGGRLAAWGGEMAVHTASSGLALGAEALYFPVGNNMGLGLVGRQMSWQHYGGEVLHGLKLMGSLNGAAFVSRTLGRGIHGVNRLGQVTRARRLAPITQPALNLSFEWGTLGTLNYLEHGGDGMFNLFEGGATLFSIRIARGLGEAAMPALRAAHKSLDLALYRVGRELSAGAWRGVASKFGNGESTIDPKWAAVGPRVGGLRLANDTRDLKLAHSFNYELRFWKWRLPWRRKQGGGNKRNYQPLQPYHPLNYIQGVIAVKARRQRLIAQHWVMKW